MSHLLVGTAEVEITPPVGTLMAGALQPRVSTGVYDPLYVKALVLDDGSTRLAYAIFDLIALDGAFGTRMTAAAEAATGIPAAHIIWSCSHTHSGPLTVNHFPADIPDPVDYTWKETLIERFAECIRHADASKRPMRARRARGYCSDLSHNRRLRYKDGREINTWLLHAGEEDVQAVGAAGPIDPEVGIVAFEDDGGVRAVLYTFALHANSRWGSAFSGDYPAVVAARLRERYGPGVTALFMPGACGDVNPIRATREIGDTLAETIIARLEAGGRELAPVLGVCHRDLALPPRDVYQDMEERLRASQWAPREQEFFRGTQRDLQRLDLQELPARATAFHIGDVAFATFPGELFVALGLRTKAESPFPWTYPVELANGSLGYLITDKAWQAGGYESLISSVTLVAPQGSEMLLDANLAMLAEMTG